MDSADMHELLNGYLGELNWSSGITKDALIGHLAGRDETLRTMINEYVAEGTYRDIDSVVTLIPAQAWQDAQGDVWRGSEAQFAEDFTSQFQEGAAGNDGDAAGPRTRGHGQSSGSRPDARRGRGGFGDSGNNAGEVDPGVSVPNAALDESERTPFKRSA